MCLIQKFNKNCVNLRSSHGIKSCKNRHYSSAFNNRNKHQKTRDKMLVVVLFCSITFHFLVLLCFNFHKYLWTIRLNKR